MIGIISGIKTEWPYIAGTATEDTTVTIMDQTLNIPAGDFHVKYKGPTITTMERAFEGIKTLTSLSIHLDLSQCTSMVACFDSMSIDSIDLTGLNLAHVITISSLFNNCNVSSINGLNGLNLSNITNANWAFSNAKRIVDISDIKSWSVPNLTTMIGMFSACYNIDECPDISGWYKESMTNLSYLFDNLRKVTSLPTGTWTFKNVTNLNGFANNDYAITELDFSSANFSKVTTATNFLHGCSQLTNIIGGLPNWSISINLTDCPLTHDAAVTIINSLGTADSQTITFSASTYSTLTDDEKAIGTSKGWSIASA